MNVLSLSAQATGNWREIIDDPGIDAVVIGTWPYLHRTLVLEALRAGKHVLTEARLVHHLSFLPSTQYFPVPVASKETRPCMASLLDAPQEEHMLGEALQSIPYHLLSGLHAAGEEHTASDARAPVR
jgi:hypothetical protein